MQSLPLSCKPMTMQITWAVRSSRPPRATLIIIATTLAQQYKIMQCLFALSYSNLNLTCSSLIKMRLQAGVKQHNKLAVQFVSFPKSVTSLHPSIFFFPLLFPPIQPPASRGRQPTLPEPGSAGGFFLLAATRQRGGKKTSSNQKLAHKGMNHWVLSFFL